MKYSLLQRCTTLIVGGGCMFFGLMVYFNSPAIAAWDIAVGGMLFGEWIMMNPHGGRP
jgi:hypothetical protein